MLRVLGLGRYFRRSRGFTLIELLVVMGIIAILAAIIIIAVNPSRQFAQGRNAQRQNDVRAALDAIHQYAADNNGNLPAAITGTATDIGSGGLNLASVLVPNYLPALPTDPTNGTAATTSYQASKDANNRVTVAAVGAELNKAISITR